MSSTWRNPYQAKRKEAPRGDIKEMKDGRSKGESPIQGQERIHSFPQRDFVLQMNRFREGIRGLSSSIQQVEKTMESITQMFQTMEKVGGMVRLDQFFTGLSSPGADRGGGEKPLDQFKRLIAMLEKIDFKQVNQFLDSPLFKGFLAQDPKNQEKPKQP